MVLREKFDKHVVKIDLYKKFSGQSISMDKVKDVVKDCFMRKKHADKTWNVYTNRLVNFLVYTGYLTRSNQDVTVGDLGRPFADLRNLSTQRRNKGKAFTTTISPYKVYEVLKDLKNGTNKNELELKASIVLRRYNLIFVKNDLTYINQELINKHGGVKEALRAMAKGQSRPRTSSDGGESRGGTKICFSVRVRVRVPSSAPQSQTSLR